MTSTAATASGTCTHHGPGNRPTSARPARVKPRIPSTSSETASEDQPQTRAQRAKSSPRAISAAVK